MLCLTARAAVAADVWFNDVGALPRIRDDDRLALVEHARAALQGKMADFPARLREDASPRIVFLSVGDDKAPARVVMGRGAGLGAAIDAAIKAVDAGDATFVKLDLVDQVTAYTIRSTLLPAWQRGVHGLAFAADRPFAWLPGQIVALGLLDDKSQLMLDRLPVDPRINSLRGARKVRLFRFTTVDMYADDAGSKLLVHGHEPFITASPAEYELAARRAADYLARNVDQEGRFIYHYRANDDTALKKYNILRHAGSIYAMLEVYELTHDEALLETANRALRYLKKQVRTLKREDRHIDVIVERKSFKIGGNALAVLALVKYVEVTGNRRDLEQAQRLAELMPALQGDDGRYVIHKGNHPDGSNTGFVSGYYPGEAMFALMKLYAADHDERWLKCAQRNAHYLDAVRDKDKPIERLPPDQWLMYGLDQLYRERPKPSYLDHARRIAAAIRAPQHTRPRWRDWYGGYDSPPRSTPTSTRSEGLCAAYALLRDHGDDPHQALSARVAAELGARFALRCQYRRANAMYLPDPARCEGGVGARLDRPDIRIDYVQHAISAWLGVARILREQDAIPQR